MFLWSLHCDAQGTKTNSVLIYMGLFGQRTKRGERANCIAYLEEECSRERGQGVQSPEMRLCLCVLRIADMRRTGEK